MKTELQTFWNNKHPLSAKAEELFKALVPREGHCTTLQGELLRASTKIGYDWFNNGWGWNNWSGAVVFLAQNFSKLPNQPSEESLKVFNDNLHKAHYQSHGEPCDSEYDEVVTLIHGIVVQALIDNPEPIENVVDMYSLQEPDDVREYYEDDEEEEW